jgi:hypothetical protein
MGGVTVWVGRSVRVWVWVWVWVWVTDSVCGREGKGHLNRIEVGERIVDGNVFTARGPRLQCDDTVCVCGGGGGGGDVVPVLVVACVRGGGVCSCVCVCGGGGRRGVNRGTWMSGSGGNDVSKA